MVSARSPDWRSTRRWFEKERRRIAYVYDSYRNGLVKALGSVATTSSTGRDALFSTNDHESLAGGQKDSSHGKSTRIVVWGTRRSGKTALMYRWKLDEFIPTVPTIGLLEVSLTWEDGCPPPNSYKHHRANLVEIGRDPTSTEARITRRSSRSIDPSSRFRNSTLKSPSDAVEPNILESICCCCQNGSPDFSASTQSHWRDSYGVENWMKQVKVRRAEPPGWCIATSAYFISFFSLQVSGCFNLRGRCILQVGID